LSHGTPHVTNDRNASNDGSSTYSEDLCCWFDNQWCNTLKKGLSAPSGSRGYIDMSSLEFTAMLLQLMPTINCLANLLAYISHRLFSLARLLTFRCSSS
jgi:hypothetical protein